MITYTLQNICRLCTVLDDKTFCKSDQRNTCNVLGLQVWYTTIIWRRVSQFLKQYNHQLPPANRLNLLPSSVKEWKWKYTSKLQIGNMTCKVNLKLKNSIFHRLIANVFRDTHFFQNMWYLKCTHGYEKACQHWKYLLMYGNSQCFLHKTRSRVLVDSENNEKATLNIKISYWLWLWARLVLSPTIESRSFGSLTRSQKRFHTSYSSKSFLNTIFVSISHHQAVIDMQDSCH